MTAGSTEADSILVLGRAGRRGGRIIGGRRGRRWRRAAGITLSGTLALPVIGLAAVEILVRGQLADRRGLLLLLSALGVGGKGGIVGTGGAGYGWVIAICGWILSVVDVGWGLKM